MLLNGKAGTRPADLWRVKQSAAGTLGRSSRCFNYARAIVSKGFPMGASKAKPVSSYLVKRLMAIFEDLRKYCEDKNSSEDLPDIGGSVDWDSSPKFSVVLSVESEPRFVLVRNVNASLAGDAFFYWCYELASRPRGVEISILPASRVDRSIPDVKGPPSSWQAPIRVRRLRDEGQHLRSGQRL